MCEAKKEKLKEEEIKAFEEKLNVNLREYLPMYFDAYEHMYLVRETSSKTSINFLMLISTFLPVFCLTVYSLNKCPIFLPPIIFQFLSLLVLMTSFRFGEVLPSFDTKSTLNDISEDKFEIETFIALKGFENLSHDRILKFNEIIKFSRILLEISILSLALSVLFFVFSGSLSLYLSIVLIFIGCFIYIYFSRNKMENNFKDKIEEEKKNLKDFKKKLSEDRAV